MGSQALIKTRRVERFWVALGGKWEGKGGGVGTMLAVSMAVSTSPLRFTLHTGRIYAHLDMDTWFSGGRRGGRDLRNL